MLRTRHTCEIVNTRKIPVKYDERLRERTLGKLDGKVLAKEGFGREKFFETIRVMMQHLNLYQCYLNEYMNF